VMNVDFIFGVMTSGVVKWLDFEHVKA